MDKLLAPSGALLTHLLSAVVLVLEDIGLMQVVSVERHCRHLIVRHVMTDVDYQARVDRLGFARLTTSTTSASKSSKTK